MKRNPWTTLAVLALAQFMVVLDVTIVNVALPSIQIDLGFSAENLQWVISAYTLTFGGFLLLGGRAADLLGRRRLFAIGLALFGISSLFAGFATGEAMLIGLRALQGVGGALMSPAALSILTVTFATGRERNIAMGIWGGLAGLGGTLGVIAGGMLVDAWGWQWVFFVNVPIVAALLLATPRVITESKVATSGPRTYDLAGSVLATAGLLSLVLGVIRAEPLGWDSAEVVGLLVLAVLLLTAFILVERRSAAPLVPLRLFGSRSLTTSTAALALNGAAFLGVFFMLAVFLQQVRGLSALDTGLTVLPMGIAAIVGALVASALVTRVGTRVVQVAGTLLSLAGLLLLVNVTANGPYLTELLPGLLLFGAGITGLGVPAQILAIADVHHDEAGAAAGLLNSGYQIGGALGLAVITTVSTAKATAALAQGATVSDALVSAFHGGVLVAAAVAAVNLLLAISAPRLVPDAEQLATAGAAA